MNQRTDSIEAVVAGHLCLDVSHPSFEKQQQIVAKIAPDVKYNEIVNLAVIGAPPKGMEAELAKFLSEAQQANGLSTGGAVSNTGIPLAALLGSENVKLVAKVGNDSFSDHIKKLLGTRAPESLFLSEASNEATSYTIVMNPGGGKPSFYAHHPGTNNTFGGSEIDFDLTSQAKVFHFGYPPLMKEFYRDEKMLGEVFKLVHERDTITSLDMAGIDGEAAKANWQNILAHALNHVDYFCPSLEEALAISNPQLYAQIKSSKTPTIEAIDPKTLRDTAEFYIALGAKRVILKCGELGLYVRAAETNDDWSTVELLAPSYRASQIVDTTGAGDNALAGLLFGIVKGYHWHECLQLANAAGYKNVNHKGPIGAFSSEEDLRQVMINTQKRSLQPPLSTGFEYSPRFELFMGERHFKNP